MKQIIAIGVALGLLGLIGQQQAAAQGTVFTYQGRLNQNGVPFTGTAEIAPTLWDAATGGNSVATNLPPSIFVTVSNGLFTAPLDFGSSPFSSGAPLWLQLGVRTAIGRFTTLTPLQPLPATPYAIAAGTAATALSVSGTMNATNLTGKIPLSNLSGITSNQLDAATWQFLVALASGAANGTTTGTNGMALIPGGAFTMGNAIGDDDIADASPVAANISPFYMDMNLVTWEQWQRVYAYATNHGYTFSNPGFGKGAAHPVQTVDWYDVVKWCNARSEQAAKVAVYYTDAGLTVVYRSGEVTPYANWTAKGYRLPTEAEWEKAARGGLVGQRFPWGNLISQTNANYYGVTNYYTYDLGPNGYNPIGNYPTTSPGTSPVGSFAPNGYGLYDMGGNVWQWCWDWYGAPYAGGTDPRGVSTGSFRVFRGGGWLNGAYFCRSAYRCILAPTYWFGYCGFRSVLPPG